MASKFLSLDEAARHLGVAPEKLSELRLQGKLYGYRDGANWKFKADDLDRYQEEAAAEQEQAAGASDLGMNLKTGSSLGSDNFELKFDDEPAAPAKKPEAAAPSFGGEDEFELLLEDDAPAKPSAPKAAAPKEDDLHLDAPAAKEAAGTSDILFGDLGGGGSGSITGASGIFANELLSGETDKNLGKKAEEEQHGSDVLAGSAPALINPTDSQLGSAAAGDTVIKRGSDLGEAAMSGISLEGAKAGGSSLKLGDDDDIFSAGAGSDVTTRPSDSGILLVDPGDSGLALDQPFDLGGGSSATLDSGELKADDDFLLTPFEEPGDESSDSGSQVIVLDETEPGPEATATIMGLDSAELAGAFGGESPMGGMGMPAFAPAASQAAAMGMVPMVRETPFSAVVVLMLTLCIVSLGVCGMMMHDVMMNMWSWQGNSPFTSPLLEMFRK